MNAPSTGMTRPQRIGLAVFATAVLVTAVMIGWGVAGMPLPRWVLALTTVL
jgi:hypothetical protein